jgi:hypothetical protein
MVPVDSIRSVRLAAVTTSAACAPSALSRAGTGALQMLGLSAERDGSDSQVSGGGLLKRHGLGDVVATI